MTPQQPPRGEHQANGAAEVAGKIVRDHARVIKIDLQRKIGRKIEPNEPIMPWLVRWAAMAVSRYSPGKDGKTAYERVLYRMPEVARDRHQALEERWANGGMVRPRQKHQLGVGCYR